MGENQVNMLDMTISSRDCESPEFLQLAHMADDDDDEQISSFRAHEGSYDAESYLLRPLC